MKLFAIDFLMIKMVGTNQFWNRFNKIIGELRVKMGLKKIRYLSTNGGGHI